MLRQNLRMVLTFWLPIVCLFIGRIVNVGALICNSRINNFVDFALTLADIFIFGLSVFVIVNFIRNKTNSYNRVFVCCGIILFFMIQWIIVFHYNADLAGFWHNSIVIARIILWLEIVGFYLTTLRSNETKNKTLTRLLLGSLLLYSLFDHLLISNSLPILWIWILTQLLISNKAEQPNYSLIFLKRAYLIIISWLGLNILVSTWQIITGHSLGLSWLGEPFLEHGIYNVARQDWHILNNSGTFLRGYGLSQHPNFLGFIGLTWTWFTHFSPDFHDQKTQRRFWLSGVGIILVILSLSRIALVGLIIMYGWIFAKRFSKRTVRFLGMSVVIFLGILFFSRIQSDFYRFEDIQLFFQAWQHLTLTERIFGLGLGQYPFWLQQNFNGLASWEWQPVHIVWLNLFVELGLFQTILLMAGGLVFMGKNRRNKTRFIHDQKSIVR